MYSYKRLDDNGHIKKFKFSKNDPSYINQKILKHFPVLENIGWICLKPNSDRYKLVPFETEAIKTGDFLKK